jgi:hypothetical protein
MWVTWRPSTYSGTRGPGTFVVTAWHHSCPASTAARTPSESSVGATKSPMAMIDRASTACIARL